MSRSTCRSSSAMTWSRISRRQLPTQRSAVPFCQGDWTVVRFGFRPVALKKHQDFRIELRVSVQNHITIRRGLRKRFAPWLDDPVRTRVARHIVVQDLPTAVFDYEEAVEQLERQRRYGEEVESDDY